MLRRFDVILLLALLMSLSCSCRKPSAKSTQSVLPDSLREYLDSRRFTSGAFSTSSEVLYENEIDAGIAAVLLFRQTIVDTIDLSSSLFTTSDSAVFYQKFRYYSDYPEEIAPPPGTIAGYGKEYYLWSNGKKVLATSFLPMFDDLFSSPALHDSCVLYWGLRRNDQADAVYAMRYRLVTNVSDSLYLMNDTIETDFSGYFNPPEKANTNYSFTRGSDTWVVDKEFRSQRRR